ncbi:MAG: hypothetical protein K0S03_1327 [Burkholderiales bacterium]|nr:hypothetical protein [Burkholderiales bacterium]
MKPQHLRLGMNLWPPFLGAGIRVRHIAEDWSEVIVDLRHGLMNRNYVGTHYGGSLFSMSPRFRQRPYRARAQDPLRPAQAALPV